MAGRCNCTSADISGAAISDTPCIRASGAGNPSSPFNIYPVLDPAPNNLLQCGSGGLAVPDPDNPGNWSAYTVDWRSSGTQQPAIGNGGKAGYYRKRGKSLEVMIAVVFGGSTTKGEPNSVWQFTLPSGMVAAADCRLPASAGPYPGVGWLAGGSNVITGILCGYETFVGAPFWAGPHTKPGPNNSTITEDWPAGTFLVISGIVFVQ